MIFLIRQVWEAVLQIVEIRKLKNQIKLPLINKKQFNLIVLSLSSLSFFVFTLLPFEKYIPICNKSPSLSLSLSLSLYIYIYIYVYVYMCVCVCMYIYLVGSGSEVGLERLSVKIFIKSWKS